MSLKVIQGSSTKKPGQERISLLIPPSIEKIISDSIAMEAEDAKETGRLGFMARALIQATMPHSDPGNVSAWQRVNGNFALFIQSGLMHGNKEPIPIGLPYGCIPRLLSSFISYLYTSECLFQREFFNISDSIKLWWEPKKPEEVKWKSEITLSQRFFEETLNNSIPINIATTKLLKNSALELDIYCWLTYRISYLKKPTTVPWETLRMQFGSDYADTKQGRYKFKIKFITQLKKVLLVYGNAKVAATEKGILLKPSKTHIKFIYNC